MGARGPAPTPTPHLAARGSKLAKYSRTDEPVVDVAAPPMPKHLNARARAHWRWIVPQLIQRRTLSVSDLGMLAMMCIDYAEHAEAVVDLEKLKRTKKNYRGHMIDHPRARMRAAHERYTKAAIQFGLTPAAKARVQVSPEKKRPAVDPAAPPVLRIAQ